MYIYIYIYAYIYIYIKLNNRIYSYTAINLYSINLNLLSPSVLYFFANPFLLNI